MKNLILVLVILLFVTFHSGNSFCEVIEVRVIAGSDDAEEKASGYVGLASSDLELVYDGSDQTVGMRFNGVDIPQGATIVNAYVQFKVDETSSVATSLVIEGEDTDDAQAFVSSKWNISDRTRTVASVSWSPEPWTTVGEVGSGQQTPDISSIIQEIVDRPDWSGGNSLAVLITGTGRRVAESCNGDPGGAPLLHVEYEEGDINEIGRVIYVAKVDGNVKYRQDIWPDEAKGVYGDIEDALSAAGGNATVILSGSSSGETYTDAELDNTDYRIDMQANKQTLRGALPSDDPSGKHTGPVTLVSTTNNVLYNPGKTGCLLKNLTISGGASPPPQYAILDEGQTNTDSVTIDGASSALWINGPYSVIHERLVVKNCQNTTGASILFDGSGTGNFYYSLIEGNNSRYALLATDGTLNIYNCVFIGNKRYALYTTGYNNPYITIKNSIFAANVTDLRPVHVISNSSPNGTISINNSVLLPHPTKASTYFLEGVTLPSPDNNIYSLPQFKAGRRPAILVLGVDDGMNYEYWKSHADECAERGFRSVFFNNTGDFSNWTDLQDYVNEGHEVASHTRWHPNMTILEGLQIQYTGAGSSCSLTIHNNTLTTNVSGGPGGENLTIDLTEYNYMGKRLSSLADYINSLPFYTALAKNDRARSKNLKDIFSQDIKSSPYTCLLDPDRFYNEELSFSKADIDSMLEDYLGKTFAPPGNKTDEQLQDALKLRGYIGARGKTSGSYLLENCEIYNIRQKNIGIRLGHQSIDRNTAALTEFLNYVGGIYVLYNHNEDDYRLENWKTVLQAIAKSNVTVMTLTEAIEHIRNIRTGFLPPGTDADGDQERWIRTFVDTSDYTLNPTSPLIDAGVDVGLTHDFAGTPVPQGQKPDIGLFEYSTALQ